MDILGIGPLELIFILILAIVILGPKDLEKTGKSIGRGLAKIVKSDTWKTVQQTQKKLKTLPNELMREAGLEEMKRTLDAGQALPGHEPSLVPPSQDPQAPRIPQASQAPQASRESSGGEKTIPPVEKEA
jgi:Sec-independent protein translocase protein TatA